MAGLSPMRFPFFVGVSTLGRLPGIVGSAIIGDAAAARRWPLVIGLGAAAVVLFVAGWLLRERIQRWIERVAAHREARGDGSGRRCRPGRRGQAPGSAFTAAANRSPNSSARASTSFVGPPLNSSTSVTSHFRGSTILLKASTAPRLQP